MYIYIYIYIFTEVILFKYPLLTLSKNVQLCPFSAKKRLLKILFLKPFKYSYSSVWTNVGMRLWELD